MLNVLAISYSEPMKDGIRDYLPECNVISYPSFPFSTGVFSLSLKNADLVFCYLLGAVTANPSVIREMNEVQVTGKPMVVAVAGANPHLPYIYFAPTTVIFPTFYEAVLYTESL